MGVAVFMLMLLMSSQLGTCSASVITLTSSPTTIQPTLTQELSLKCALEDSAVVSGPVGKRDGVAETRTDISHLISLVVQKNGVDIASITPYSPAAAVGDQGSLNVTGQIAASTGFLLLNWSYPGDSERGNLTCEANGIDATGHTTSFSTSLMVDVKEPSLTDLMNLLAKQAQENKDLLNKVNQQTSLISDLNKQVSQQSIIDTAQSQDIAQLKTCACNNDTETASSVGQVQSGLISCGDSRTWRELGRSEITKTVTFSTPYSTKPVIHLSPVAVNQQSSGHIGVFDSGNANHVLGYSVEVQSVSTTGFTMRCHIASTSSIYRLSQLDASWVSIPQ